jgi:glycosyltransferase involved in cell wall biosynthesis
MSRRPLHFALLGSRGIPNRYGGYETLMEELARRLVEAGFRVTVYCRSHSTPKTLREFKGAELVVLPTLATKYLDTPVHTLLSCLHAWFRRYDAALMVNSANALFVPLLRLRRLPVALNVDGIEKRRAKWGAFGRLVYALSERLACWVPTALVTDAQVIHDHYLRRYGAPSTVITYGVDPRPPAMREVLARLGLRAGEYFLYVSRFEPENNPHRVAEAYRQVGGDLPLVMVGGAPYARGFIASFTRQADPRILFPGPIYGDGYRELLSQAKAYIQATEVGGTHPALVEAMGYARSLVVNDTPENREVAGETALYFRAEDPSTLASALEEVRRDAAAAQARGQEAARRAQALYSWPVVCDRYAELLTAIARR